jgi:glycosyltransferase involved in cell wall biosynthesis
MNPQNLALVMISNFGRSDGGRETWAYQFLPRVLARQPDLRADIYALRVKGEPDTTPELIAATGENAPLRLHARFFEVARSRVPNSLKMIWAMFRHNWQDANAYGLALGVGSFVELICMLVAPGLRGIPKAVWLRTIYIDEKSDRIPAWLRPAARTIETVVLRRADLIIANGDDTAEHYRARGLTVEVIKNAVDLDRWRMAPPKLELPLHVAFIGRLSAVKGIGEFLKACEILAGGPHAGSFRFHVIGDGDFAAQAEQLESRGDIIFHGAIPNDRIPATLQAMDVCVALTFEKDADHPLGGSGVSNALLEQMGAGRVCLCWDNRIFRNVLDDGSAFFVHQGSVDDLVRVLEHIAMNLVDARDRAAASTAVAHDYGIEAHVDRFAKVVSPWLAI